MRRFFSDMRVVIILALVFSLTIIGFNVYDIAFDKTHKTAYTEKEINDIELYMVNINTADEKELSTLPNISDDVAKNIVDYRKANGEFETIDEIQNVKGIGEKTFNNIRSMITV